MADNEELIGCLRRSRIRKNKKEQRRQLYTAHYAVRAFLSACAEACNLVVPPEAITHPPVTPARRDGEGAGAGGGSYTIWGGVLYDTYPIRDK